METTATLESKREEILLRAARYGAHNVRLFGSTARGEGSEGSDLDFLVDMEDGRTLLDLVGLSQELREFLGREVDVVTERSLSPYLRDQILAEAKPL